MFPPQLGTRLGGISTQHFDFRWPKIAWIYFHQYVFRLFAEPAFVRANPLPLNGDPDFSEGQFNKFAHRMAFASCKNIITGFGLLQNEPHSLGIIARMPPITLRIQITNIETILFPQMDGGDRLRDFTRYESLATPWSLMVEQDTVRRMKTVSFAIIDGDPIGIELGRGLTDFLYQRDGETIAFARSDLAVSGTGSSSVAPVVGIRAKSVA